MAVVALAMAVAGCGVRSSGVITGNAAPSGPAEGVTLYLVLDGKLSQVLRATSEQLTPEQTLNLLAAGPDPSERTRGFSSAVPGNIAPVTLSYGQTGQATLTLAADVNSLSTMAADQLVCTARDTLSTQAAAPGPVGITLTGHGQNRGPQSCPLPS
ncbi:hypothetical protein [Fodinicola feengrottensis]|uniref:hypothetical protein n=1 Tax=Fodinicola feengrottensis TaxID=435914 RepID=UPI0031E43A35